MDSVLQDVRYAFRRLSSAPGFTLAVVLTLAAGIGGTAATFSVLDAAALRPLPFPDANRLVRLREMTPQGDPFSVSEPEYLEYVARMRTLASGAAMRPLAVTLTGAGEPARIDAAAVTSSIFPLLGIRAAHGRVLTIDDERDQAAHVTAVLSHAMWRERFGGDPRAVGRTVSLDGRSTTIVGVLPETATFPAADLWVALNPSPASENGKWLDVIGRLAPGASVGAASDEAVAVTAALAKDHPRLKDWSARVEPLQDWILGPGLRRMAWLLLGAVGTLLALACANIAGLLMARASGRRIEMGVRAALGAERWRLVRQLVTENLLLGAAGGVVGLLTAAWILFGVSPMLRDVLPPGRMAILDGRAVLASIAIMLASTIAFGLFPALHASRPDIESALRAGGRGTTPSNRRWSSALVSVQVALAMVLIVGSFLLTDSFARLSRVDIGFAADRVVTVPLSLPERRYPGDARVDFFDAAIARLASVPDVESAAATATNPFRQWGFANDVTPEEQAATAPASGLLQAGWRSVTPGFFETLGVPLVRGRAFSAADRGKAPRVAIVSQSLAARMWPGQDPVGRRFYWGGVTGRTRTVIGVVGDIRDVRLDAAVTPMLYLPYGQLPLEDMTLLVRTRSGASNAEAIRRELHALDPSLPVAEIRPLAANRSVAMSAPRFRTMMLGVFGVVALLLASVGLYGVVAFTVSQRTREIAIRVALGARPRQVTQLFFRRGAALTGIGAAAGLFLAWAAAGVVESLLFQTSARNPWIFAAAAVLLTGVALTASYLPARRASRFDPVRGLIRE